MGVPARIMNDMFNQRLNSGEGKEKLAEFGGTFIRDRLREVSFARKMVPPEQVTRADCQVSTQHDTLTKIVQLEPKSRAMSITFRGQPTARYIRAPRMEAAFFTISSEQFQKTEQELLAYDMPITKIIEENSVKDLEEVEDRTWLCHVEAAVQAMQYEANGNAYTELSATTIGNGTVVEFSIRKGELARTAPTDDATVRPVQRPDIVNLFKMLDGRRLRAERMLITEVDCDDVLQWTVEDFGDRLQSETAVDGYKYNTLLGRPFIRTIKTDILRPGNIYCFTKPEFFGRYFILNNSKFYIDKVANLITFQAWEDIAMCIANVASVKKVELYSGNANPNAGNQALIANFIPVAEDALGALNNRVDQGIYMPLVSQF
jgi:hypothetical protein